MGKEKKSFFKWWPFTAKRKTNPTGDQGNPAIGNSMGVENRLSNVINKFFAKATPDIKNCCHGFWRFLSLVLYLMVAVPIIYKIIDSIYCTACKVEVREQAMAIINNDNGLYSLALLFLAIVAIICPLLFLVYGNKYAEQDNYAISNNESYYKMVHHIINVLSDMEMRDKQKECQKQQPCITKEDLEELLNRYLKEPVEKKDTSLNASVDNLSRDMKDTCGKIQ